MNSRNQVYLYKGTAVAFLGSWPFLPSAPCLWIEGCPHPPLLNWPHDVCNETCFSNVPRFTLRPIQKAPNTRYIQDISDISASTRDRASIPEPGHCSLRFSETCLYDTLFVSLCFWNLHGRKQPLSILGNINLIPMVWKDLTYGSRHFWQCPQTICHFPETMRQTIVIFQEQSPNK